MAKYRIYHVVVQHGAHPETDHLVEATSQAAAVRHVMHGLVTVGIPSTAKTIELVGKGVKVEIGLLYGNDE